MTGLRIIYAAIVCVSVGFPMSRTAAAQASSVENDICTDYFSGKIRFNICKQGFFRLTGGANIIDRDSPALYRICRAGLNPTTPAPSKKRDVLGIEVDGEQLKFDSARILIASNACAIVEGATIRLFRANGEVQIPIDQIAGTYTRLNDLTGAPTTTFTHSLRWSIEHLRDNVIGTATKEPHIIFSATDARPLRLCRFPPSSFDSDLVTVPEGLQYEFHITNRNDDITVYTINTGNCVDVDAKRIIVKRPDNVQQNPGDGAYGHMAFQ